MLLVMSTDATTAEARPTRYRKLRIAWSVAWGVVAVLLCVLWVRSYWVVEGITTWKATKGYCIGSGSGGFSLCWFDSMVSKDRKWVYTRVPPVDNYQSPFVLGVRCELTPGNSAIVILYWLPTAIAISLFATALIKPVSGLRFSLRTLLVAFTLVAVGLGVVVWASR